MPKKNTENKIYIILFSIIILSAIYLRFVNLSRETFCYSEIETLQATNEYFKGNFINNFYTFDTPPLRRYVLFLSILFLGENEFAFRIISASFGVALVIITYLMTMKFFNNKKMSVLASMITAFSIIHLQFSRYLTDDIFLSFFYTVALYFFWKFTEKKDIKSYIMLGIFIGLAMASRFMAAYLIFTIIIYSIIKGHISIRLKPRFSLSIENKLIKAFLISILMFFLTWPFSLISLQTNMTIKVPELDNHENTLSKNIPIFILSFGKRLTGTGIEPPPGIFQVPLISYFLAFLLKENLLIIVLFILGIYYTLKNLTTVDKFILFSVSIFFIFLWLQNWGFSTRYIIIIIPLIAILAAKSINLVKKEKNQLILLCILGIVLFLYALFSEPSFSLSYNILNNIFPNSGVVDRQSEGMRETINFLFENCNKTLADRGLTVLILPYKENFATNNLSEITLPTCVVKSTEKPYEKYKITMEDNKKLNDFIETYNCTLEKSVIKNNFHLYDIFFCK